MDFAPRQKLICWPVLREGVVTSALNLLWRH
jgi:hypothetical protein